MAAYEPSLCPDGQVNIPGQKFKVKLTFGSSVLTSYRSRFVTVARNSAGNYTFTFPRTYRYVTGFKAALTKWAAGAVLFPVILTDSINTASSSGGGTLVVEFRAEVGTATDPASGNEAILEFEVSNDVLLDDYTTTV